LPIQAIFFFFSMTIFSSSRLVSILICY
jgi:hypothetical protein